MIAELEACAFRSWPAAETVALDGWRLRAMAGVTRRANSAFTAWGGDLPLAERIAAMEDFYRERGLRPLVQLSPLCSPELDAALATRGYAVEARVDVLCGDTKALAAGQGLPANVSDEITEAWFALSGGAGRFGAVQPIYRGLLERIGSRALYASACRGHEIAAVGLGVIDGPFLGVFSMWTRPHDRGVGLGGAVLSGLARAGEARGARHLYLQVERDNLPARGLYRRAGLERVYGYHYRRGPGA